MAHFAELDENNKVIRVIVLDNWRLLDENKEEVEQKGIDWLNEHIGGGRWIQTSYNGNFRGRYAGVDGYYDEEKDVFIHRKPTEFPSWVLIDDVWQPPIPCPSPVSESEWPAEWGQYTPFQHYWDEPSLSWKMPVFPRENGQPNGPGA